MHINSWKQVFRICLGCRGDTLETNCCHLSDLISKVKDIKFGISCQWYRYRECDEVVNVQGMIENIFEKELLQQQNEEESSDIPIFPIYISYFNSSQLAVHV